MAAELAECAPGEIAVFAPGAAAHEERYYDGRAVTVRWLEAGTAFGWPGLVARLREDPRRAASAAAFVCRARAAVRAFAPTRVVAHWALPSAWPIAPAGIPLDVISHGADVRLLAKLPGRVRLVRLLLARASSWRFVSELLRDELAAALPAALAEALRTVALVRPPTVACSVDDVNAATLRATVAGPLYVAVGRLVPSKRVDRIVRHVADVAGATLIVVGDGPERAALQALAARARVRARFVGERPRSEALAWIRAADWLCFASEAEGASCVLSEAAALGTRVLSI